MKNLAFGKVLIKFTKANPKYHPHTLFRSTRQSHARTSFPLLLLLIFKAFCKEMVDLCVCLNMLRFNANNTLYGIINMYHQM